MPPSPLLSLSQEEFFMRDVSVSTSTTQVSKSKRTIFLIVTLFSTVKNSRTETFS